jgi:hypothetical protein
MKFDHIARIWWTDFGTKDISFGIHICWAGRIDLHIWTGMLSLGNVPIYEKIDRNGKKLLAVSNSFHIDITKTSNMRAGVPR